MSTILKAAEVKCRISKDLKLDASTILESCGLNISSAIRLFLEQVVVSEGLPFEVKAKKPSQLMMKALEEARVIDREFASIDEMLKELDSGKGKADS